MQFLYAFYLPAGLRSRLIFYRHRLRLLTFFQAAPAPVFFQAALAQTPRSQKHPAPTGSGYPALTVRMLKLKILPILSRGKRQEANVRRQAFAHNHRVDKYACLDKPCSMHIKRSRSSNYLHMLISF